MDSGRIRAWRTPLVIVLFCVVGTAVFGWHHLQQERKRSAQELMRKGSRVVNLLSLYPVEEFSGERRGLLLKTLSEHMWDEGFAYLIVHDTAGHPLVSLVSGDAPVVVPPDVEAKSLYAMTFTSQDFDPDRGAPRVHEFSKPIFDQGEKVATVRLGLQAMPVPFLSVDRLTEGGMLGFFMLATAIVGYYLVFLAARRLKNLGTGRATDLREDGTAGMGDLSARGLVPVMEHLDQSITDLRQRLKEILADKAELTSRLGVAAFEKDRVIKILDSLDLGIVITDLQDHIGHMNQFMLRLFQQRLEEAVDRPLRDIVANDEVAAFIADQDTSPGARAGAPLEVQFPELAPREVFEVSALPLTDRGGASSGRLILMKNITRRKMAESAQEQFIAHVAHELMTPLTSLRAYSEMLMDGEVHDPGTLNEYYNTINDETRRLTTLIQNLLNISKMEAGALTAEKEMVRTDWLLRDCLPAVEAAAVEKDITILKQLPDRYPALVGDKELLKAALINVLGNAVKYTPREGTITVALSEYDHSVRFDVTDTGGGISAEDLPHVFERFYRSGDPNVREQTGSGLGLAITSEIVHLHEGRIEVESEPGKGTHFAIHLPREDYTLENQ